MDWSFGSGKCGEQRRGGVGKGQILSWEAALPDSIPRDTGQGGELALEQGCSAGSSRWGPEGLPWEAAPLVPMGSPAEEVLGNSGAPPQPQELWPG